MKFGVLGGTGFLGKHVCEHLADLGCDYVAGSRSTGVDARSVDQLIYWLEGEKITHIINLAAECGGIGLNKRAPADLWLASTMINAAVLDATRRRTAAGLGEPIQKLTMVGTACSYAAAAPPPFKETDIMCHGLPEYTNSAYGVAKLSAYFGTRAYRDQYNVPAICLIPVNLYGPHDHFSLDNSHVVPALIRKFVEAKAAAAPTVTVWGTGAATREFLYAGDAAEAIVKATLVYDSSDLMNVGSGIEISIKVLTNIIAGIVGYKGEVVWDSTKPDGQMRRCLDTTRARDRMGWVAKTGLYDGLAETINWYKSTL